MKTKKQIPLKPHNLRELKSRLPHLKPVVIIGHKGLTEAVLQEIEHALTDHELIKIRIKTEDRKELFRLTEIICSKTAATPIQIIGYVAAIYRENTQAEED